MAHTPKQAFNPYLPLNVYIPDGEPHVFGDRIYIYGSHDREGGTAFCELDYEVYSAPVDDLANWRSEGIAYSAKQDPAYSKEFERLYAPDVVKGNDGRYYLYYSLAGTRFTGPIHVAVSDSPAGPFAYYGEVHKPDGTPLTDKLTFDPAVLNDGGVIRLYYGWSLSFAPERMQNRTPQFDKQLLQAEMMLFGKSKEELDADREGIMGAYTVELEDDMLTTRGTLRRIAPGQVDAEGTSFAGHAFFEASSMRKIGSTYYFIYSSQWQHELCYATSSKPDRDFVFGGVIISNGDIGYQDRKTEDRLAATGNNHGSIENINGKWYVFYHRQTHKNTFNRQGCAERIAFTPDGKIPQVEMTSCGLNDGPLAADGPYSACIACNLTNGHMPHIETTPLEEPFPHVTNVGEERFVDEITDHTRVTFKYFAFNGKVTLSARVRGAAGMLTVFLDSEQAGEMPVQESTDWHSVYTELQAEGTHALTLQYEGAGALQLMDISFTPAE